MKKFFKGLLIFILVIVLLVGGMVAGVVIVLSDKTNDVDISQYDSEVTPLDILSTHLNKSLNEMKDTYEIELTLSEAEVNNIIYNIIKTNINPEYNPVSGTTEAEKNVYVGLVVPNEVSLIGGEVISVNSIYAEYIGNNIKLNVTINGANIIRSRVQIEFKIETTDNEYILSLVTLKLGKINLIGKGIRKLGASFGGSDEVNDYFNSNNIPFTLFLEEGYLKGNKEEVNNWLINQISKDDDSSLSSLLQVFLANKDAVQIGMFDNSFGIKASLEGLRVDSALTTLDPEIETFNESLFVSGKAQTYIVNKLAGNNYITISELELNQIFCNSTNHYEQFASSFDLLDNVSVDFKVDGLIIDLSDDGQRASIRIILNINGLKTIMVAVGDSYSQDDDIVIRLDSNSSLGSGYTIDSNILTNLLEKTLGEGGLLTFNANENALIVPKSTVSNILSSGSSSMDVERLEVVGNGIRAYIVTTTTQAEETISEIINIVEGVLSGEVVSEEIFNTDDPEEASLVSEVLEQLGNISEILSDPNTNITPENAAALIDAIGEMSEANQEAFFSQMAESIGEDEINRLYQQLFGGGN